MILRESQFINQPLSGNSQNIVFGNSSNDYVEFHMRNGAGEYIEHVYDISNYILDPHPSIDARTIELNIFDNIIDLGYISGKYTVEYNFFQNVIGSYAGYRLQIQEIAPQRNELRCLPINDSFISGSTANYLDFIDTFQNFDDEISKPNILPALKLNFGENNIYSIFDYVKDDLTFKNPPFSLIFKLDSILADNVKVGDTFWVIKEISKRVSEKVIVYPPKKERPVTYIKGPNYEAINIFNQHNSTPYVNWTDLLAVSSSITMDELLRNTISSSIGSENLNVDFRDFKNFIFFSSATERLKNFEYKVGLIEFYNQQINNISSSLTGLVSSSVTGSTYFLQNVTTYKQQVKDVIRSFDAYENYLYFQSASYTSSSIGDYWPTTWPKKNLYPPYSLYEVTSSIAQAWLVGALDSASLYDAGNVNALRHALPEYYQTDPNNAGFALFVDMIGQHYDILYQYIKHLLSLQERKEGDSGFANRLAFDIAGSYGLNLSAGFKNSSLWELFTNYNSSGSINNSSSLVTKSQQGIEQDFWKRIVNNLPYLLQTKGTERSIRALITCYGIPSTILRIKEYCGPTDDSSNYLNRNIIDKFVAAFHNSGSATTFTYVPSSSYSWEAIELRFKPETYRSGTYAPIITFPTTTGTATLEIQYTSGSNGLMRVNGATITTPISKPFFNGGWWWMYVKDNVTRSDIDFYQSTDGVINLSSSLSFNESLDPGTITLGGRLFTGSYQELRVWSSFLDDQIVREHTHAPGMYHGNDNTGSISYLKARFPLGTDNGQLYTSASAGSLLAKSITVFPTAEIGAFSIRPTASYFEEKYYKPWPNGITDRPINEKIRINDNFLYQNVLATERRQEANTAADLNPIDSHRFGAFFSPQDEINEDIVEQMGAFNLGEYIGDSREYYESQYSQLDVLRNLYFSKYKRNYNWGDYNRLITFCNGGMFELIKQFLPARSDNHVGLVIEPTMLERSKIQHRYQLAPEDLTHQATIPITEDIVFSGGDLTYADGVLFPSQSIYGTDLSQINMCFISMSILSSGTYSYYIGAIQSMTGSMHGVSETYTSASININSVYDYLKINGTQYQRNSYYTDNDVYRSYLSGNIAFPYITQPIPYWRSTGVSTVVDVMRTSETRYIRQYYYSSSLLLSQGRAYSSSLVLAQLSDSNLDCIQHRKIYYEGTQITGAGINIDSDQTIDGGPVVTRTLVSPNTLKVNKGNSNEGNFKIG